MHTNSNTLASLSSLFTKTSEKSYVIDCSITLEVWTLLKCDRTLKLQRAMTYLYVPPQKPQTNGRKYTKRPCFDGAKPTELNRRVQSNTKISIKRISYMKTNHWIFLYLVDTRLLTFLTTLYRFWGITTHFSNFDTALNSSCTVKTTFCKVFMNYLDTTHRKPDPCVLASNYGLTINDSHTVRSQNVGAWCWRAIWNLIFVLISVVDVFSFCFARWHKLRKTSSRIKNGEVLKRESTKKEAKKSQPLYTASTPISGENIF